MARYDYACESCGKVEEQIHSMKESPEIKCSSCGSLMKKKLTLSIGSFAIKGGSEAIHWREKRNRMKAREDVGARQKARWGSGGSRVTPNIAGVAQESWSDCQKLAKECGLNTDSYTPAVEKEKKEKKGLIVS